MLPESLSTPVRAQNRDSCIHFQLACLLEQWIVFAVHYEVKKIQNDLKYSFKV